MTTASASPFARPEEVLRRLELTITRRLDGLLAGDYRGLIPGHGWDLGEAREYQPGDDVRRIDWNVTARSQAAHVRDTIADRELETWVLADLSPSLDFGTANCTKRDLVLAAAAAVGFLTGRRGNRIGAVIGTRDGLTSFPARTGRSHLLALLSVLARPPLGDGGGVTDLADGVGRLRRLARRRGLAVVISDFLSTTDWQRELRGLVARHSTLAIEVLDPRELQLPSVGVLWLVDPETGQRREVQTSDAGLRARYAAAARDQRDRIAADLRRVGADHVVLRTDRDWLVDLVRFVALRRRRIDRAGGPR